MNKRATDPITSKIQGQVAPNGTINKGDAPMISIMQGSVALCDTKNGVSNRVTTPVIVIQGVYLPLYYAQYWGGSPILCMIQGLLCPYFFNTRVNTNILRVIIFIVCFEPIIYYLSEFLFRDKDSALRF